MKSNLIKTALVAGVVAACVLASLPASAGGRHRHGPGVSFGFVFGPPVYYGPRYYAPYYGPRYYPYAYAPYYASPPYPVVEAAPAAPPVYVERESAQSAPALPAGYWYYCAESQAYYPHVKQCPGGWQQVPPQPAS